MVQNMSINFFRFVIKHAFDKRTYGRTEKTFNTVSCILHYMQSRGNNNSYKLVFRKI